MSRKHKKTQLLIAALSIGIFFAANSRVANSTIPNGADSRAAYQPPENKDRVLTGAQPQVEDAALMARLDLNSREFNEVGTGLRKSKENRQRKESGTSASLVLIGLGFALCGSAVVIRRGNPS
jgi:hypothetical protein